MSIDFDPVRLDPKRRRLDPVVVGVVVVVIALAVAIIKPWDSDAVQGSVAAASAGPTTAASAPQPSAAPSGPARVAAAPLSWADVATVVADHETWGVRGILGADGTAGSSGRADAFADRWSPTPLDRHGRGSAFLERDERSVVMLGVTAPGDIDAIDARVWLAYQGDQFEWIDTVQVDPNLTHHAFLFSRPGTDGQPYAAWGPGTYRIDILTAAGIREIDVRIPDVSGHVPGLNDPPLPEPGILPLSAIDASGILGGLFATTAESAVPLGAIPHRRLDRRAAWLDVTTSRDPVIASAYLPRTTGLGVMLASGDDITASRIRRLAPDGPFRAPGPINGMSDRIGNKLFVLFPAPDGIWRPGTYAITLHWTTPKGQHEHGTWHVELRPGLS
jgi:hypothetical protein